MPRLTAGGEKTALADVEDKLKREYPHNSGAVFGTLNKIGLMHGPNPTSKGMRAAEHHATGGLAGPPHLQMGGLGDAPWLNYMARSAARQEVDVPYGFLNSGVAGRTDRIPASVAADSFVIPAAEVSGLGQGNSIAGAHYWSLALGGLGPHGVKPPPEARGPGPPSHHPPPVPGSVQREIFGGYSQGGRERKASVILAGGEMVIPPWKVQEIGGGDMKEGQRLMRVRNHTIKRAKKLPLPKE